EVAAVEVGAGVERDRRVRRSRRLRSARGAPALPGARLAGARVRLQRATGADALARLAALLLDRERRHDELLLAARSQRVLPGGVQVHVDRRRVMAAEMHVAQ